MKFTISEIFNISNILSAFRMLLVIPIWVMLDEFGITWMRNTVAVICIIAAITDILDGYFARKFNQITEFGKIIDPVADKVIIAAVVIKLFIVGDLPSFYFIIVLGRDLIILLGGVIVTRKIGKVLPSNVLGKITVIFISLVLIFMLFRLDNGTVLFKLFYYLSILLVIISLAAYTIRAIEFIKKSEDGSVRKFQF